MVNLKGPSGLLKTCSGHVCWSLKTIYQANIGMASYEALYGRKCKTPICWDEVGEQKLYDVELIEVTFEKIQIIKERLKTAQD